MRRYINEYFETPEEQTLKPSHEELKEIIIHKHNEGMTTNEIVKYLQDSLHLFNDETETEYEKEVVENIINNRPIRNRWTNIEFK